MTKKRKISKFDWYNFCWKCHNGEFIFEDNEVKDLFLDALDKAMEKYIGVQVAAYAIMSNHVHLVIGGKMSEITSLTKSIGARFGKAYHMKTHTTGEIFERRFFSNPIDDIPYFLNATAYVFNNPVKANMVRFPQEYHYSNFKNIYNCDYKSQYKHLITDKILNDEITKEEIVKYTLENNSNINESEFELYPRPKIYDYEVRNKLIALAGEKLDTLKYESAEYLRIIVSKLLDFGACIYQISRICGIADHRIRSLAVQLE